MEECARRWEVSRWRGRLVLGEKVENEGRTVLTSKSSREERGVGCLRGLERRAFEYIRGVFTFVENKISVMSVY